SVTLRAQQLALPGIIILPSVSDLWTLAVIRVSAVKTRFSDPRTSVLIQGKVLLFRSPDAPITGSPDPATPPLPMYPTSTQIIPVWRGVARFFIPWPCLRSCLSDHLMPRSPDHPILTSPLCAPPPSPGIPQHPS